MMELGWSSVQKTPRMRSAKHCSACSYTIRAERCSALRGNPTFAEVAVGVLCKSPFLQKAGRATLNILSKNLRSGRAGARRSEFAAAGVLKCPLPQKHFGCGIGEAQPLRRELKAFGGDAGPAAGGQLFHFVGPFGAQVVAGGALEFFEGPAGGHAQAKGGGFAGASEGF